MIEWYIKWKSILSGIHLSWSGFLKKILMLCFDSKSFHNLFRDMESFKPDSTSMQTLPTESMMPPPKSMTVPVKKWGYHAVKTPEAMEELSMRCFAVNSEWKMKWVLKVYGQWRAHCTVADDCNFRIRWSDLRFPHMLVKKYLAFSLSCFITEIVKMNGDEYPLQTLYQMVICIQIFLESQKLYWKLLDKNNMDVVSLFYTLDNIMKERTAKGYGVKQSASVVSKEAENKMWEQGVLGEDMLKQLLDTVLFLIGMNCALCRGEEHKHLRRPGFNPQLTIGEDSEGVKCLMYREDLKHKTNQGGLEHQYQKPCIVHMYEAADSTHCPVHLFTKYISLLPEGGSKGDFYMHPLGKPTFKQWYAEKPVSLNTLCETVKHLVLAAGLPGKFMNHSLRASAATRLYQGGVPEKLIKEVTGHRSEAVRDYEWTGDNLKWSVSAVLGTSSVKDGHEDVKKHLKYAATGSLTEILDSLSSTDKVKNITVQVEYKDTAWKLWKWNEWTQENLVEFSNLHLSCLKHFLLV